jgi:hypothetical protein
VDRPGSGRVVEKALGCRGASLRSAKREGGATVRLPSKTAGDPPKRASA